MSTKERREERQREAQERQAAREKLGDAGQLAKLEKAGHGHCKEAERLRKRLQKEKKG